MKRAAEYLAVEGRYTTTVLSVMEVVRGFYRIGAVDRADQFVSFLSAVEVLPFDTESAILAGRIDAALTNRVRVVLPPSGSLSAPPSRRVSRPPTATAGSSGATRGRRLARQQAERRR